jgi:hypothetical protein
MAKKQLKKQKSASYKAHSSKIIVLGIIMFTLILCINVISANEKTFIPNKDYQDTKTIELGKESITNYGKYEITESTWWDLFGWFTEEPLIDIELKDNTEDCEQYCSATKEITIYKDTSLVDEVRFYTIEGEERILQDIRSYNFYIKEKDSWIPYTLGEIKKTGTYEVKLEGEKKPSRTVDWQVKTNGEWLDDWAVWGAVEGYIYDVYDNSVNTTLWYNVTSSDGGGGCGSVETTTYINYSCAGAGVITRDGELRTINIPVPFELIRYMNFSYSLRAYGGVNAGGYASFNLFGRNISDIACGEGCDITHNKYVEVYKNNTNITVYIDGVFNSTYSPTNSNISVILKTVSTWGPSSPFTRVQIGPIYYTMGSYITLNSPANSYTSNTSLVNFNATATISGGASLVNMSLWHNASGTWQLNQSILAPYLYDKVTSEITDAHEQSLGYSFGDGNLLVGLWFFANKNVNLTKIRLEGFPPSQNYCELGNESEILQTSNPSGGYSEFSYVLTAGEKYYVACKGTTEWDINALGCGGEFTGIINKTNINFSEGYIGNETADCGGRINTFSSIVHIKEIITEDVISGVYKPNITTSGSGINWGIQACDSDNACSFSENRTLSVDTIKPTFTLNSINNTWYSSYVNSTINITTTDISLSTCSYNTSDNSTTTIYTCNTNIYTNFYSSGLKNITVTANDTIGNTNSTTYSFTVPIFMNNITYVQSVYETSSQTFGLNLSYDNSSYSGISASLIYDGTSYVGTKIGTGSSLIFNRTILIPSVTGTTNKTFYWSIALTNSSGTYYYNTTSNNQTVNDVSIDTCLANPRMILNISLKDEELNSYINMTQGSNIEIDLIISSLLDSTAQITYHNHFVNNVTASGIGSIALCVPDGLLNYTTYKIDFTIGYDSTDHVREFYYMDNGTLDNTNAFNSYTNNTFYLMDLLTTDSTTFLFSFTDEYGSDVPEAIVHVYRKYIGEGLFREVERAKQDNNGQTHVHLVEEDVIYYFMVSENGQVLYNSDTYNAKCLSTPCEISLSLSTSTNWSVIDNEGGKYTVATNKPTRTATTTFMIDSPALINVSLYKITNGEAILINSSSSYSASDSIDLVVPLVYGNSTFFVAIYKNGEFIKSQWVSLTESGIDYFGTFGGILAGLIILAIMLMAISEGAGFIIFTAFALIIVGIMQLVDLSWMALISIILAGGVILYKLVSRRNKVG